MLLARVDTERLLQELLCDDGEHCATSRLARVAARVDAWVAALPARRLGGPLGRLARPRRRFGRAAARRRSRRCARRCAAR